MNPERTEAILLSLKRLDYLTRSQLQRLHNLGGVRNANKILSELSEYLNHWREGENIYYLSMRGREYIGATKQRKKTPQVQHFLIRNDAYLFFNRPTTWQTESKITDPNTNTSIIPDAIFQRSNKLHLLEIDHTQKMIKNQSKIEKYRKLSEYHKFKLIWITSTDYRKKRLGQLCQGLNVEIYTIDEMR